MDIDPRDLPVARLLPEWWWSRDWNSGWLRVSTRDKDKLANNAEAATVLAQHPAMKKVTEVGGVTQILSDEKLRRELNVIAIRRCDASPHADSPNALMGYLWPIPEINAALFLITDSAADFNVRVPGEPLPGNATMHLLQSILLMPNLRELHAASWDRLVRESRFGAGVVAAAQLGQTKLYSRGVQVDIYTPGGKMAVGFENQQAAGGRDGVRDTTTRGALGKLLRAQMIWPYSRFLVPPGYLAVPVTSATDGRSGQGAFVVADVEHAESWTAFYRAVAAGSSWLKCGRILAEAHVPARGQKHARKSFANLSDHQLRNAARSAASLKHIEALATLKYRVEKEVPSPNDGTWYGYEVHPGGDYGSVNEDATLPDHGIRLTQDEWDACRRRIETSTSRVPTSDRNASLCSSIPTWQDGEARRQLKLSTLPGYYHLRARTLEAGVDDQGARRGWLTNEGDLVGSFRKAEFDRAVARLVQQGGEALLASGAVFHRPASRLAPDVAADEGELEELTERCETARDSVAVWESAVAAATPALLAARTERLHEAEAERDSVEAALARLQGPDGDSVSVRRWEQSVSVDIAEFAALAAVLEEAAGERLPRVVNDSVLELVGESLRLRPDPEHPMLVTVSAVLRARDGGGEIVEVPVSTDIRDVRLGIRADESRAAAAARLVFADGCSVNEAATFLGCAPGPLAKEARSWMVRHGVAHEWSAAKLIDCPVAAVRRTAWELMMRLPPSGDAGLTARIEESYFSGGSRGGTTWARTGGKVRRVMRAFELAAGRGIDLAEGLHVRELARATGLTTQQLSKLAGPSSEPFGHPLRRSPAARSRLQTWACPACARALTHIVLTDETSRTAGLICTACRQTADGIPLPDEYMLLWDLDPTTRSTVEGSPDQYASGVPGYGRIPQISMADACRRAELPAHVLRTATSNGTLACVRRGGCKERWFDPGDVDAFAAARRTLGLGRREPVTRDAPVGHSTLGDAAAAFQVEVHVLRRLALSTPEGERPLRFVRLPGGAHGVIAVRLDDIEELGNDWLRRHRTGQLRIGDVAKRTGLTVPQVRGLILTGVIPCARSDRRTAIFDPVMLEEWLAGPGHAYLLLTPRAAAALAGCTVDTLRRANRSGALAAERTHAGDRRYNHAAVVAWASSRPVQ